MENPSNPNNDPSGPEELSEYDQVLTEVMSLESQRDILLGGLAAREEDPNMDTELSFILGKLHSAHERLEQLTGRQVVEEAERYLNHDDA